MKFDSESASKTLFERGYLKVRPYVNEHLDSFPEASPKARDKPFGGKVLEIDCFPSGNLFFL